MNKTLYTWKNKIYESPDGGRTIFQREFGSDTRVLVGQNLTERSDPMAQLRCKISYSEFIKICDMAETNPTLNEYFTKLLETYELVRNHG